MAATSAEQPLGGFAPKLSRDVITRAALAYIDRHGPHRLTMRALGQDLGVEAMSLYRYVANRRDLMEAVVAVLLTELRTDLDGLRTQPWTRYLQTLAASLRRIALEHPKAFPLLAAPPPAAPWLPPPLPSIEVVEELLTILSDHGFSDDEAVDAYRTFSTFLLGQLVIETAIDSAKTPETTAGAQTSTRAQTSNGAQTSNAADTRIGTEASNAADTRIGTEASNAAETRIGTEASNAADTRSAAEATAALTRRQGPTDIADSPTLARMRSLLITPRTAEEFHRSLTTVLEAFTPQANNT